MHNSIHICILTTAHPIDDVRVNHKFAQAFLAAGFKVTWVGPNHTLFGSENYGQDKIQFKPARPIRGRVDRLLSSRRLRPIAEQLEKVDVYFAPDPDSASLAVSLSKSNGSKVIFDIHEIFHGAMLARWFMGYNLRSAGEFIRRRIAGVAAKCDLVIGVSESVLKPYVEHGLTDVVVRSCAPSWFAGQAPADVCGPDRKYFTIMHGKSSLGRGTAEVVEAAGMLVDKVRDLRVVMFESFRDKSNGECRRFYSRMRATGGEDNIDLRPMIPMQEMPNVLQACDAGFISYGRDLGVDSLPNRLFEYMAAGIAIIAPVYAKEIAKIIESERCGILVDFEDPADIASAIIKLSQNPKLCREMGKRAREAFVKRHNWDVEVRPVIDRIKEWQ